MVKAEQAGVEDRRRRDVAPFGTQQGRGWVQAAQDRFQLPSFFWRDQIKLVDHDHVGKFHLFDQEIGNRALIFLVNGQVVIGQRLARRIVAQEVVGIDHRYHRVEPGDIA